MAQPGIVAVVADVGSVIHKDKFRLTTPLFQRAYEWNDPQLIKLVADVVRLCQPGGPASFLLGSVVFQAPNGQLPAAGFIQQAAAAAGPNPPAVACDIIDGQQRLTTLLILMAVIQDMLLKESGSCSTAQLAAGLIQMADGLRHQFHVDAIGNRLCVTPRLRRASNTSFHTVFSFRMPDAGQYGLADARNLNARIEE